MIPKNSPLARLRPLENESDIAKLEGSTPYGAGTALYWAVREEPGDDGEVLCNPCIVREEDKEKDQAKVELTDTNEHITIKKSCLFKQNPPKFYRTEDMSMLTQLYEPCVFDNLKSRYITDFIYTTSGKFLMVVNPYRDLKITGPEIIQAYAQTPASEQPPHIYQIAMLAYNQMQASGGLSQSILCTGESGAGKTENCKSALRCLTWLSEQSSQSSSNANSNELGSLEKRIMDANIILESFGNAKTTKNDNSSRFGKFTQISYDSSGQIITSKISTFLLEKSRVTSQAHEERNFHIFYMICEGLSPQVKSECHIGNVADYKYMNNGQMNVRDVQSKQWMDDLIKSFEIFNIEAKPIYKILSAVLLFGNLDFKASGTSCVITNDAIIQKISQLLQINVQTITRAITEPTIKIGSDVTKVGQSVEQCRESCLSVARAIYESLFNYLVKMVNKATGSITVSNQYSINIVDIAGFEIFKKNSLEQLCINNTNEKLQQFFNSNFFIQEAALYKSEGIEWNQTDYGLDLQPTIDLINGVKKNKSAAGTKMGIFDIINDVSNLAALDDKALIDNIDNKLKDYEKFSLPKPQDSHNFSIQHYAGKVNYWIDDWVKKNKHPMHKDVIAALKSSTSEVLSEMFQNAAYADAGAGAGASRFGGSQLRSGTLQTGLHSYISQLNEVMEILQRTEPHFVRCIIPNLTKTPGKLDYKLVRNQLRSNGILEGIRIVRQGYPNRMSFMQFKSNYHMLSSKPADSQFADAKEFSKALLKELNISEELFRVGNTKLFFKAEVIGTIEDLKGLKMSKWVSYLDGLIMKQYYWRELNKSSLQREAREMIRRNVHAWNELRGNEWFKLTAQVVQTMKELNTDIEMKKLKDENSKLQGKITDAEASNDSLQQLLEALKKENADLKAKLLEKDKIIEINEMNFAQISAQMGEFEALVNNQAQEIDTLKEENSRLSSKRSEDESTLDTATAQIKDLEASKQQVLNQLTKSDENAKAMTEQITTLEDQVASLKSKLQSQESQNSTLKSELEITKSKVSSSSKQSNEIAEDLEEKVEELEKLKTEFAKKAKEANQYQRDLETASEQKIDLDEKISRLQAQNDRSNTKINDGESKLQEVINEREELSSKLMVQRNELETTQEEVEKYKKKYFDGEKRITDLTSQLNKTSEELISSSEDSKALSQIKAQMKGENDILQNQLTDLETQMDDLKSHSKSELQKVKQEAATEIATMKSNLNSANTKLTDLETQLEDAEMELTKVKGHDHEMTSANKKLESHINELTGNLESLQSENGSAKDNISKLQGQLKESVNEGESLKSQIDSMKTKVNELGNDISANEQAFANLTNERRKLKQKVVENESEINRLVSERDELEDNLAKSTSLASNLQAKADSATSTSDQLTQSLEEETGKLKKISSERDSLVGELASAKNALKSIKQEKKRLQSEVENNEAEISQLKNDLDQVKKGSKNYDSTIKQLKQQEDEYMAKIQGLEGDILKRDSKITKFTGENEELEQQVNQHQSKIKQLEAIVEENANSSEIQNKLTKAMRELNEKTSELERIDEENQENEIRLSEVEGQLRQSRQKLDSMASSHQAEMEERSDSYNQQLNTLKARHNDLETQNLSLMAKIKTYKNNADGSSNALSELQSENDQLKEKLDATQSSEKKVTAQYKSSAIENENLMSQISTLENRVSEMNSKNSQLQRLADDAENTRARISTELNSVREEMDALQENLSKESASHQKQKRKAKEFEASSQNAITQLEELQAENQETMNKLNKVKAEAARDHSELLALRDTVDSLQTTQQSKIASLNSELDHIQSEFSRVKSNLNSEKKKTQSIQSELEDNESKHKSALSQANSKISKLNRDIEEQRQLNAQIQDREIAAQEKVKSHSRTIRNLKSQISICEDQVASMRKRMLAAEDDADLSE